MVLDPSSIYLPFPPRAQNRYPYQYQFFSLTYLLLWFGLHHSLLFWLLDLRGSSWSTGNSPDALLASFSSFGPMSWPSRDVRSSQVWLNMWYYYRYFLHGNLITLMISLAISGSSSIMSFSFSSELIALFFWDWSIISYISAG